MFYFLHLNTCEFERGRAIARYHSLEPFISPLNSHRSTSACLTRYAKYNALVGIEKGHIFHVVIERVRAYAESVRVDKFAKMTQRIEAHVVGDRIHLIRSYHYKTTVSVVIAIEDIRSAILIQSHIPHNYT